MQKQTYAQTETYDGKEVKSHRLASSFSCKGQAQCPRVKLSVKSNE